ncbi:alcohol dehydrogenase catalytic domain-containing protein [Streptomyces sp. JNUCC 63]
MDATTVCGSDPHIRRGDFPGVKPGTVLGHEAVGEIVEIGGQVHHLRPGDQVIVSSVSACGHCRERRDGRYGQCRGAADGSWGV